MPDFRYCWVDTGIALEPVEIIEALPDYGLWRVKRQWPKSHAVGAIIRPGRNASSRRGVLAPAEEYVAERLPDEEDGDQASQDQ